MSRPVVGYQLKLILKSEHRIRRNWLVEGRHRRQHTLTTKISTSGKLPWGRQRAAGNWKTHSCMKTILIFIPKKTNLHCHFSKRYTRLFPLSRDAAEWKRNWSTNHLEHTILSVPRRRRTLLSTWRCTLGVYFKQHSRTDYCKNFYKGS